MERFHVILDHSKWSKHCNSLALPTIDLHSRSTGGGFALVSCRGSRGYLKRFWWPLWQREDN